MILAQEICWVFGNNFRLHLLVSGSVLVLMGFVDNGKEIVHHKYSEPLGPHWHPQMQTHGAFFSLLSVMLFEYLLSERDSSFPLY